MGDVVRSKGRKSSIGRLQTTTGGDDRHHVQAQPRPASEETAHDDSEVGCHSQPGGAGRTPKARGKAVSGRDRCNTLSNASHGSRGLGRWTQLNRQKDDVAAGEQYSDKKQSDLVSLNPEEKPR